MALTDELTQVREQTIADESPAPDRRKMTADAAADTGRSWSAWTISEGRAVADQDEITYLLELRDTTKGRLRSLTIQRAAFGLNAPRTLIRRLGRRPKTLRFWRQSSKQSPRRKK